MNIVAQIIGIIAFIIFILSFQCNKKSNLIKLQLLANLLYAIQYFLLDVPSAYIMNIITVVKCAFIWLYETKTKELPKSLLFIFIGIIFIASVFTYDGYLSLIPIFLTTLYTIATWQKNMQHIRILFIFAALFWIIYNLSVGAYSLVIGNIFEIISGIIGIIRFNKKK